LDTARKSVNIESACNYSTQDNEISCVIFTNSVDVIEWKFGKSNWFSFHTGIIRFSDENYWGGINGESGDIWRGISSWSEIRHLDANSLHSMFQNRLCKEMGARRLSLR